MSQSRRQIAVRRCANGHAFLHAHECCTVCGEPLAITQEPATAVLVAQTIVRVNPTGDPYRLGIAKTPSGAKTLCRIDDDVPSTDGAAIGLERRGDLYHATTPDPGKR